MITAARETIIESVRREPGAGYEYERWTEWPVHWTGVWVGALAGFAIAVLIGLVAVGLGAHLLQPDQRIVDLRKISLLAAAIGVFGSFLAAAGGGWVAGKIAGIRHAEPAMLHGAIAWLVSVPLFLVAASLGAGGYAGSWYAGLRTTPDAVVPYERPDALPANASAEQRAANEAAWNQYRQNITRWREETPKATRNAAICAASALLLGLIGSVIGGWMASGEPMTFTYARKREELAAAG